MVTHKWEIKQDAHTIVGELSEDLEKIVETVDMDVVNGLGMPHTKAEVTEDYLIFNGVGPLNAQPFCYMPRSEFLRMDMDIHGHCDAGRMPYDRIVRVLLLCMKHHLGSKARINSDDSFASPAWQMALKTFQVAFPDRDTKFFDKVANRAEPRITHADLQDSEVVDAAGARQLDRVVVDEVSYRFWKAVGPEVTVIVWDNGNSWCSIHSVHGDDDVAVDGFWTRLERIVKMRRRYDEEEAA